MRTIEPSVSREVVIRFYAEYDRRKKRQPVPVDLVTWPWRDPEALDARLRDNGLKPGVLSAYKSWWLVELDLGDLLDCAIVNHIFPGEPQALGQLVVREVILRPALRREHPAKWYIEDGSGRALALVQRMLRSGEPWRTACAYLGIVPDENSCFIRSHPELGGNGSRGTGPAV